MKKVRTSLFLVVALGLLAVCPVGLADEFADKSVPLFCAVGWLGEFTHIDPSVGEVPPTRNDLPYTLQALAYSPDGILYAGTGYRNGLYKIDPRTGNAEYFLPTNVDIAGMAFSPSGELYVTGSSGARYLRTIDLTDGSSTSDRTLWGDRNSAQGLAFSPDGTLYAIKPNVFPGTYELLTIDLDDAQMHLLGSYSSTANVNQSITFTADGRLYAIGADAFAQLNPTDGSLIGSHFTLSGDYRGLAIVPPMVYYVDADVNGANNGSSWADAFNYLQDALATAWSGDEIWVAQGIYKPDQGVGITPGDREATFQLINGVTIKGGYAGFGEPDPNTHDIELYNTILTGDLNGNDGPDFANNGENSYHVVTGSATNETAILDGFTITAGKANGSWLLNHYDGGGLSNYDGSPTIGNCTFTGNWAGWYGGGIYNEGSSPTLFNCTIIYNAATGSGSGMCNREGSNPTVTNCTFSWNVGLSYHDSFGVGMYNYESNPTLNNCALTGNSGSLGAGMYNYYSNPIVKNCTFTGNLVHEGGGGMRNIESSPTLINCTFSGNWCDWYGVGGMESCCSSTPTLTNCILWSNMPGEISGPAVVTYCDVQGGWPGTSNIDTDPCFVSPGYWNTNGTPDKYWDDFWVEGDYHLLTGSPCIDTGDPNYIADPNETDLDGRPRVIGGRIDMGAYESPIPAEVSIVPRTINLTSRGKWITCYIWLGEDYDVADIEPNSILLENEIEAESLWVDEQQQVVIARFSRSEVQAILNAGEVELTITGQLTNGTIFEGTDVIRVKDKGGKNIESVRSGPGRHRTRNNE